MALTEYRLKNGIYRKTPRLDTLSRGKQLYRGQPRFLAKSKELSYRNNPDSLFKKYSLLVTWFANIGLGKDFLSLPKGNIDLLLPNGFQLITTQGGNEYERFSSFSTRAIYSPLLSPALRALDLYLPYFSNFNEVQRFFLNELGILRDLEAERLKRRILFTVSTFNPNADPETTSVDGTVTDDAPAADTWAGKHDAADGDNASDIANVLVRITASATTNRWDVIIRAFLLYDSSSLPDGDDISAANIQLWNVSKSDQLSQSIDIITTTPASNTAIVVGDYDQVGTVLQATSLTIASITTSAYNTWTFNATGIGNISKTGISKFGARCSGDTTNTEPTWSSAADALANNESAEDTNKPRLEVTHDTTTSTSSSTSTSTSSSSSTSSSTSTTSTTTSTSTSTTTSTSSSTSTTSTSSSTSSTTSTSSSTTTTFPYTIKVDRAGVQIEEGINVDPEHTEKLIIKTDDATFD